MTDTVSVIIPACNIAARIRPCLESIIAQDYPDIEIIVVDDASGDGTGDIAREVLGSSGRRHKVITHARNKGVSAARNTGLEASRGEYVCFVDGDDFVRENFVSSLHVEISRNDCDLSFCGLTDRFTDGRKDVDILTAEGKPCVSCGENIILSGWIPPMWCCMYRADFLKAGGLVFLEGCSSGEDVDFITRALCRAERVTFTEEYLYIYMHHDDMGSVKDNSTRDKKILRYEHNTNAQISTAKYLVERAKSRELRDMAGKILMPQSVVRRLNLAAMKDDREGWESLLSDSENMRVLREGLCRYTWRRKPEVFMKALMIVMMPGMYYVLRRGKIMPGIQWHPENSA